LFSTLNTTQIFLIGLLQILLHLGLFGHILKYGALEGVKGVWSFVDCVVESYFIVVCGTDCLRCLILTMYEIRISKRVFFIIVHLNEYILVNLPNYYFRLPILDSLEFLNWQCPHYWRLMIYEITISRFKFYRLPRYKSRLYHL